MFFKPCAGRCRTIYSAVCSPPCPLIPFTATFIRTWFARRVQGKLQRLARMSAALAAQSVALEASQAARMSSRNLVRLSSQQREGDGVVSRSASDVGSTGVGKSSLASFLEFQQTLSDRYRGMTAQA